FISLAKSLSSLISFKFSPDFSSLSIVCSNTFFSSSGISKLDKFISLSCQSCSVTISKVS
ncbi:MAG: hypothetical protein LBQ59_03210, partial [Candidatus Peribacteria bacterium]|nr:hypothetical protein [Candidatus Peribacteria bacterium]